MKFYKKKLFLGLISVVFVGAITNTYSAEWDYSKDIDLQKSTSISELIRAKKPTEIDYFLNLSFYASKEYFKEPFKPHVRELGFGFNPVVSAGNFTLESDAIYGENRVNAGAFSSRLSIEEYSVPSHLNADGLRSATTKYLKPYSKKHLKYGYSRLSYNDIEGNRKIVVGDINQSVTFGPMIGLSGCGFSISSQNGMYKFGEKRKVNSQSLITLMYPSKIEIKHNGNLVQTSFLDQGNYSVYDLAPEARAGDGYEIKIIDPMNRSYTVYMDLYGDKEVLPEGQNEYEFNVIFPHKFNSMDSFRHYYEKHFAATAVYRWAVNKNVTANTGVQVYKDQILPVLGVNWQTCLGLFSQTVGFSYNGNTKNSENKNAFSYEAFYRSPWTIVGRLDVLFSILGKGYGNLGRSDLKELELLRQYLAAGGTKGNYIDQYTDSKKSHLNIRYAPVNFSNDYTLAFAYDVVWIDGQKDRSYDLCIDIKQSKDVNWSFGIGLTQRDTGVTYARSLLNKDKEKKIHFCKRFYVALDWTICEQLSISSSYDYDSPRASNYSITYKPKQVKGLELEFNPLLFNGSNLNRVITYKAKYACKWFETKFDYANKIKSRNNGHSDRYRLFFNTCFNNGKFTKLVKTHYMYTNSLAEKKALETK